MKHRRRLTWLMAMLVLLQPALAAELESLPAGYDAAIDRGLLFLQKHQKGDGSFDAAGPPQPVAALAVLAFLSAGHMPEMGKYGLTVRRSVDYLVRQQPEEGYFGQGAGGLRGHCVVTMALAEVYGMEAEAAQRTRVRNLLDKALEVIFQAQDVVKNFHAIGGWGQDPTSRESDLVNTSHCIMALMACRKAGLDVPAERFDRALAYVLSCYHLEQKGFARVPKGDASVPMTTVGLMCLHRLGAAARPEAIAASQYLAGKGVTDDLDDAHFSQYMMTLAMFHRDGPSWPAAWKRVSEQLLASQNKDDGSWPTRKNQPWDDGRGGRVYATATALLTLSLPLRLLPMHQP